MGRKEVIYMKKYLSILTLSLLIGALAIIPSSLRAKSEKGVISGLKIFIDVTTMKEHMKMMEMMKLEMEMDPEATHHFSLNLEDEKTNDKITEALVSISCLSSGGKEVDSRTLGFMPKMDHFGGNITLKNKGKYYLRIEVYLEEIKTRYSVTIPFVVI